MKLSHAAAGFIFMAITIGLFVNIYGDFQNYFGFEENGLKTINGTETNIMQHLDNLNLMQGMEDISDSIQNIGTPATTIDILGNLAGLAIGVLKIVIGIASFPLEMGNIILAFYGFAIPSIIINGIATMFLVYMAFILFSAYLRSDL